MSSRSRYNTPPNAPGFPGHQTQHEVEKLRRGTFERGLDVTGDVVITGSAGIGTASISSTAQLQVDSATKGFLPPRMTTAQREAITSPDDGLVVYDTTVGALYCREGGSWVQLSASGGGNGGSGGISKVSDAEMLSSSPSVGDVVYNTDTLSLWQFDGTFWLPAGSSTMVQDLIEEFPNPSAGVGTHDWHVSGGSSMAVAGEANHPGIYKQFVTSNNVTVSTFIGDSATSGQVTGDEFRYTCFVVRPFMGSVPDTNKMAVGLHGDFSSPGADTTKIIFHFDLASGTNWRAQTNDGGGGGGTSVDTGVAVTDGAWYRLEIYKIGSTVKFYINGASVATIDTSVPTTSRMFFGTKQRREGSIIISLDHDYARLVSVVNR